MKIRIIISLLFIINTLELFGQKQTEISLDSCMYYAEQNFPLLKNNKLNMEINSLQNKNYSRNFFPKLDFNAQASYQSQTIDINIETQELPPGAGFTFPSPPLDQYALTLNLSQNIWDGGLTKHLKEIENQKFDLRNYNNKLSFFQIKKQINEVYFGILILQKTEEQIQHSLYELKKREETLQSGLKNGIITRDNLDLLSVTILLTKQKIVEIQENISGNYAILAELTGKKISGSVRLRIPKNLHLIHTNNRTKISVFNTQNKISETNIKLANSKRLPKIGAFAVGGYGNPGLTAVKDEWNPYFIVGAKIQWNIWDWRASEREKQIQKINIQSTENQKETFTQSVKIQTDKLTSEMNKLKKLSEYDLKILELHKKIENDISSKLQNGTANSTDYIIAHNAKEMAAIQYEIHKIQLIKCQYDYLIVTGNY